MSIATSYRVTEIPKQREETMENNNDTGMGLYECPFCLDLKELPVLEHSSYQHTHMGRVMDLRLIIGEL